MPETHVLKIKERWFVRLRRGVMTCELRINDRDFQVGDYINFNVEYSGSFYQEADTFTITHVLTSDVCEGLKEGYCILSLAPTQINN